MHSWQEEMLSCARVLARIRRAIELGDFVGGRKMDGECFQAHVSFWRRFTAHSIVAVSVICCKGGQFRSLQCCDVCPVGAETGREVCLKVFARHFVLSGTSC